MERHQFQIGERIVYGTRGVCLVEDIRTLDFARDKTRLYYVLKPAANPNSTFYTPVTSEQRKEEMRYALSKEQTDSLLAELRGKTMDWIDDRNGRASYFHEILAGEGQKLLILMAGCIYSRKEELRKKNKKLSVSDENALHAAEKRIREEFGFSLKLSEDEVGAYIRRGLGVAEEEDKSSLPLDTIK